MPGLSTQQRAQLRATNQWTPKNETRGRRMDEREDFYTEEPVRHIGRQVIRPGQVVSTVIAAGNAQTVTFTTSDGIDSHKGFEVAVVHGPPDGAAGQHRRVVIEAQTRAAAAAQPRPAPGPARPSSTTPTPRRLP